MALKRFLVFVGLTALLSTLVVAQQLSRGGTEQQGSGTPFNELIRIALEHKKDYLALKEQLEEARARIRQAEFRPSATLDVEAGFGAIAGSAGESEYSAAWNQPLERRDKRIKRRTLAETGLVLAEAELGERERELAFEVKMRAVSAVTEELRIAATRAALVPLEESHRLTLQRVALGDAAPLEEQMLLAEVRRMEAQIVFTEAKREAARTELRLAVGAPGQLTLGLPAAFEHSSLTSSLEELQGYGLSRRPDLKILQGLEEQAAAEVELAEAESRPDVTVSARYTRSYSKFDAFGLSETGRQVPLRDADNMVTFGLSIPIGTKKRAQPAIDAARARLAGHKLQREARARAIPLEIEAAYRRWVGATRTLDLLRAGVLEPSRKSLSVMEEAFRLGQLRLLDVLNERRRIAELELSLVDAEAGVAIARTELERAIGGNLP